MEEILIGLECENCNGECLPSRMFAESSFAILLHLNG